MLSSPRQPSPRAAGARRSSSSPERCTARTCRASHPRPRPRCEPRGTWLCSARHVPPSPAPGGCFFLARHGQGLGPGRLHAARAAGHDFCTGDVVVAMRKDVCFPRGGSEGCKRDKLLREETSAPRSHPACCTPCLGLPVRKVGGCLSASCQNTPSNWVENLLSEIANSVDAPTFFLGDSDSSAVPKWGQSRCLCWWGS